MFLEKYYIKIKIFSIEMKINLKIIKLQGSRSRNIVLQGLCRTHGTAKKIWKVYYF